MAKPSSVPTWATDTNYAASSQPWAGTATKVQPPSVVQTQGFAPEDPIVAQYESWWKNNVGQWASWLDGLFDASGNLTLDLNASVKVQGTGSFKHGSKTLIVPPTLGSADGNSRAFSTSTRGDVSGTPLIWWVPIQLQSGKRITAVHASVTDNATGPTRVRMTLWESPGNVNRGSITTSGTAGTNQQLDLTGLTLTTDSSHFYALFFDAPSGTDLTTVLGVWVDFDEL